MNLIRKIKISEIVSVEFTETEQEIIDIFNDNLSDLVVSIDDSKPDEINYTKLDGTVIMQKNNNSDILWVRYDGFWEVLKSKFYIQHTNIQTLIQFMVGGIVKYNVYAPIRALILPKKD